MFSVNSSFAYSCIRRCIGAGSWYSRANSRMRSRWSRYRRCCASKLWMSSDMFPKMVPYMIAEKRRATEQKAFSAFDSGAMSP